MCLILPLWGIVRRSLALALKKVVLGLFHAHPHELAGRQRRLQQSEDHSKTWPAIAVGTKPLPRSTETTASRVWLLASTRLVTLTGRDSVKLPVNTAPGTEPEHCRTISPRRSVRPSARTCTGEVVTWHRAVEDGGWANAAQMPICRRQTFKTVRLRFVISRLGWSYYPLYPAICSENPGPPDWPFWLCAGIRGTPRRLCPWHELSRFPKTVRHP